MATTTSSPYAISFSRPRVGLRDLAELVFGFGFILAILWMPTHEQLIFGPIALLIPLILVLARRPSLAELGLGRQGFISSWWILPAAVALEFISVIVARELGTYHPLYQADLQHVGGYVIWTLYQQFLLQDYFMPRLTRLTTSDIAIGAAAVLFAVAHLPNLVLAAATLVWGGVSCWLFRRYRNLWILGLVQGLLGLCFAVCVPDALHHHMRVGLGYFHYHSLPPHP